MPERVYNNASSTASRWRVTRPELFDLYQRCKPIVGKYDDDSLISIGICVKPNKVLEKMSLFTTRAFHDNEAIIMLPFNKCNFKTEFETMHHAKYTFKIPRYEKEKLVVDTWDIGKSNAVRFLRSVNEFEEEDEEELEPNVMIEWYSGIGVVCATRYIDSDEELISDYEMQH